MGLTQRGTPTLASILVFSLTAVGATPALAQTGSSTAQAFEYSTNSYACNQSSTGAVSSANCAATPITSGLGSATSAQAGLARTLSANAGVNQTDLGMFSQTRGDAVQFNQFNVVGTSGSSDQLVFHILTNGPYATGAGGVGDLNAYGMGFVYLSTPGGTALSEVVARGDGRTGSMSNGNWTAGAGFMDFVFPFSSFTGGYNYFWEGQGVTFANFQPQGLTLSGGFSGTLDAIYAVNGQGQTYGSVDFNTAQLDLTSSVPEPASLALLATGLFGLVPMMRRKLRK